MVTLGQSFLGLTCLRVISQMSLLGVLGTIFRYFFEGPFWQISGLSEETTSSIRSVGSSMLAWDNCFQR